MNEKIFFHRVFATALNFKLLKKSILKFFKFGFTPSFSIIFFLLIISDAYSQTTFNFTGAQQTYLVPTTGCYTIRAWGAKGGNDASSLGGNGGYAVGDIYLTAGQTINIYVGGLGASAASGTGGGWNGGGNAGNVGSSGGGGGASDVRVGGTALSNRVIVAAGGGGAGNSAPQPGGAGGGTSGITASGGGGTQTAGGTGANPGALGLGGNRATGSDGGGGGGGYYGGGAGTGDHGGGGGSSYIAGLLNASSIAGNASMPNPTNLATNMTGNSGAGVVIITFNNANTATLTTANSTVCHGNVVNVGGNVSVGAGVAWTLNLSNSQTTSGTGPGTWSIPVTPTGTTTYTLSSLSVGCSGVSGSTTITLPTPSANLATNNQNATCVVNAGQTVRFYETTTGNYITTVTAGATSLGSTTARVFVDGTNQLVPACNMPQYETAVMQRHWVITPTTNGSATVRLPYTSAELSNVMAASITSSSPDDLVTGQNTVLLSKYSAGGLGTPTYTSTVNANPNDNCAVGGTTLHTNGGTGSNPVPTITSMYSDFSIPGFSEFWLHGMTVTSPLPVTLSNFSAKCEENGRTLVSWTTASEQNSDYFTLERSRDGLEWDEIEIVDGAGTTSFANNYEVEDYVSADVYYRLTQTDFDGVSKVLGIIHIDCGKQKNELIVYPNPTTGTFTIAVNSTEKLGESTIVINDLCGKEVASNKVNVLSGTNTVSFDANKLAQGTYLVSLQGKDRNSFLPVRLVIQ